MKIQCCIVALLSCTGLARADIFHRTTNVPWEYSVGLQVIKPERQDERQIIVHHKTTLPLHSSLDTETGQLLLSGDRWEFTELMGNGQTVVDNRGWNAPLIAPATPEQCTIDACIPAMPERVIGTQGGDFHVVTDWEFDGGPAFSFTGFELLILNPTFDSAEVFPRGWIRNSTTRIPYKWTENTLDHSWQLVDGVRTEFGSPEYIETSGHGYTAMNSTLVIDGVQLFRDDKGNLTGYDLLARIDSGISSTLLPTDNVQVSVPEPSSWLIGMLATGLFIVSRLARTL